MKKYMVVLVIVVVGGLFLFLQRNNLSYVTKGFVGIARSSARNDSYDMGYGNEGKQRPKYKKPWELRLR